ncbi:MAG: helix-turn-helix domain-containing protein, partial [Actinomycetota bacterium]
MSGTVSVTRALGSSTRAGIYDHLRQVDGALTVRDVADTFDLHPNVARTHLGLLAEAGLLTVGQRKHPGGGRPARVYRARPEVEDDHAVLDGAAQPAGGAAAALMVRLLVTLLDRPGGPPLVARALEASRDEGRRLVSALPGEPPSSRATSDAAQRAVRAIRAYAPDARVDRAGSDWAEVSGLSPAVALVERLDPALAEAAIAARSDSQDRRDRPGVRRSDRSAPRVGAAGAAPGPRGAAAEGGRARGAGGGRVPGDVGADAGAAEPGVPAHGGGGDHVRLAGRRPARRRGGRAGLH